MAALLGVPDMLHAEHPVESTTARIFTQPAKPKLLLRVLNRKDIIVVSNRQ